MRDRFPWWLTFAYAAVYGALGALRYAIHRNFVDFGIFEQTLASAFGCFCNTVEGSHWAFHSSPILFAAGAVVALWRSPYALIALQSVACALVIPPIYALVARADRFSLARTAAVVVGLYPALGGLAFGDFHENVFAPAAVAWMVWAFDAGHIGAAIAAALIAISVKEDQAIFVGIAGILAAVRFRGTQPGRAALAIAAIAVIFTADYFHTIQPHAAINPHWAPTRFYAWSRQDVAALVPMGVLDRVGFVVLAFAPLGFLPFRSRAGWLCAVPLVEVLTSRMSTTFTLGTHYAGAWIGYALVAFAFALRSLPVQHAARIVYACTALCAIELLVANPLHPSLNIHVPLARDRALDRLLATLPDNVEVATQEEAFTHLALRDPHATVLPDDPSTPIRSQYVLIDRDFPQSPRLSEYGAAFEAQVHAHAFELVRQDAGAELYRSSSSAPGTSVGQ